MRARQLGDHALVLSQFVGVVLCAFPLHWHPDVRGAALLITVTGGALGIAVLYYNRIGNFNVYPEVKPNAKLITSGPYACIRHPMYSALMLAMLGLTLYNGERHNAFGMLLVMIAVVWKARREERYLCARFPSYAQYTRRTRRFIPYLY